MNITKVAFKLQNILDKQFKTSNIFNAVLAVTSADGELDWAGAVGEAGDTDKIKMQVDTPYFIASITKMYTAAVIMHLREKKLLNLDDSILKYLPTSLIQGIQNYKGADYTSELKIVHLLSHTSGLADYFTQKQKDGENVLGKIVRDGDLGWDITEVMRITREELTSKFKPGESNEAFYSDTNYQLLGKIIESVTSQSLSEVYDELIFTPLKLKNSYLFTLVSMQDRPQPAQIYHGDKVMNMPLAMESFGPDGGIVSTAQDSLAFLKAFLAGALFPGHYLEDMKQWNKIFFPLQYGYGLMRFQLPRILSPFQPSQEFIGHSGASAFLFYAPQRDLYMAGTLNQIKEESRPFRLMIDVYNATR